MNLYLVENDRTIDKLATSIAYNQGVDVIICFNYLVYLRLKKESRKHIFLFAEELLTPQDYQNLYSITDAFASNWYFLNEKDFTIFNGVSYGELVKITFSRNYLLSILVKYGEIIRNAVEKCPTVSDIYYDFSNSHNSFFIYKDDRGKFFNKQLLVEEVSRQLNRKCSLIIPNAFIPSVVTQTRCRRNVNLKRKIKYFIERKINEIRLLSMNLSCGSGKIYLYNYSNLNSLLNYMSGQFILNNFEFSLSLWLQRFLVFKYLKFENMPYSFLEEERKFIEFLKEKSINIRYTNNNFIFNGIDYFRIYAPVLKDLFLNRIPELLKHMGKVRKAIKRFRINKIIVRDEIDEEMQAVLAVCKSEGVKSFWIDHGIQGQHPAQKTCDKISSDTLICSGFFYRDYYNMRADEKHKCVVLGNPSIDNYPRNKVKKISSIKNILFLAFEDNFYARLNRFAYQEKYYEEIFSIFPDLIKLKMNIYFKPHPSYDKKYFNYIFDFFKVDVANMNYIEKKPFSSIIYDMDLVISNVSSCFYESQAAGVPTIFLEPNFNPDSVLPPLNGINWKEVIRVSTGKEILNIIMSNQNDPKDLNSFLNNFLEKYAELYMGKLDGESGRRIVEFLSRDAS